MFEDGFVQMMLATYAVIVLYEFLRVYKNYETTGLFAWAELQHAVVENLSLVFVAVLKKVVSIYHEKELAGVAADLASARANETNLKKGFLKMREVALTTGDPGVRAEIRQISEALLKANVEVWDVANAPLPPATAGPESEPA